MGMAIALLMILAVSAGLGCKKCGDEKEKPSKNQAPPGKENEEVSKNNAPPGMVLVPAGEFTMGMSADEGLQECKKFYDDKCKREEFTDEGPMHKVYLDVFYIDKHEVTQAEYDKCVAAGKCEANKKCDGFTGAKQPVVGVSWKDAKTYCEWAGKRLPTEAEWEKAARGTDGRIYPWGNEFDGKKANFCDKNCKFDWALKDWDDGYAKTAPVGSYPAGASPYGALDMAGNVFEWTADWYQKDYYDNSPERNPKGPDAASYRVLRDGGWTSGPDFLRVTDRNDFTPAFRGDIIGFRCARD